MTARTFVRRAADHKEPKGPVVGARETVPPVSSGPSVETFAVPHIAVAGSPLRRFSSEADVLGGGPAPDGVADALRGNTSSGNPLPTRLAEGFAGALGTDLSHVRVHTDAKAAGLADALDSRAFTRGSNIYFAKDAYEPKTLSGQRLLAHELAHVVQGTTGPTSNELQVGRADDPVEADADRIADQVMQTLRSHGTGSTGPVLPTTEDRSSVRRWNGADTIRRFYAVVDKGTKGRFKDVNGVKYQWIQGEFDDAVWEVSPINTGWWLRNLYQRRSKAPGRAGTGGKGLSSVDKRTVDGISGELKTPSIKELIRADQRRNKEAKKLEARAEKLKAGSEPDPGTALEELETETLALIEGENFTGSEKDSGAELETDSHEVSVPDITKVAHNPGVTKPKKSAKTPKPFPTNAKQAAAALWAAGDTHSDFPHIMKASRLKLNSFIGQREVRQWLADDKVKLTALRGEWEALQAANPVAAKAKVEVQNGHSAEVNAIYDDMQTKFKSWKADGCKDKKWRGAWWGADTTGSTGGAKSIPKNAVPGIRALSEKTKWIYKDSDSGGMAFHRTGPNGVDFIYHQQPPPD